MNARQLIIFSFLISVFSMFGQQEPIRKGEMSKNIFYQLQFNANHDRFIRDMTLPIIGRYSTRSKIFEMFTRWEERFCLYAFKFSMPEKLGNLENPDSISKDIDLILDRVDYFSARDVEIFKSVVIDYKYYDDSFIEEVERVKCLLRRMLNENIHKLFVASNGKGFPKLNNTRIEYPDVNKADSYVYNKETQLVEFKTRVRYDDIDCRRIYTINDCHSSITYQDYADQDVLVAEGNHANPDSSYRYKYHLNGDLAEHSLRISPDYYSYVKLSKEGDTLHYSLRDYSASNTFDYKYVFFKTDTSGFRQYNRNNYSDTIRIDRISDFLDIHNKEDVINIADKFIDIFETSADSAVCYNNTLKDLKTINDLKLERILPIVEFACDLVSPEEIDTTDYRLYGIKKRDIISSYEKYRGKINDPNSLNWLSYFHSQKTRNYYQTWNSRKEYFVAAKSKISDNEKKIVYIQSMNDLLFSIQGQIDNIEYNEKKLQDLDILDTLGTSFRTNMIPLVSDLLVRLGTEDLKYLRKVKKEYLSYQDSLIAQSKFNNHLANYGLFTEKFDLGIKISNFHRRIPNFELYQEISYDEGDRRLYDIIMKLIEKIKIEKEIQLKMDLLSTNYFDLVDQNISDDLRLNFYFLKDQYFNNLINWTLMVLE